MKKTRLIFLVSVAVLFAASVAMLFGGCKKSDDTKGGDLIGKWNNETPVGVDDVVITTLEFTDDNMLHVTVNYSDLEKAEDNLDFTLPYEVKGDILSIMYDYKDVDDLEYVDCFQDKFEIKDNYILSFVEFVENLTGDADGTFVRVE